MVLSPAVQARRRQKSGLLQNVHIITYSSCVTLNDIEEVPVPQGFLAFQFAPHCAKYNRHRSAMSKLAHMVDCTAEQCGFRISSPPPNIQK
jgi:hypothetical protein